MTRQVRSLSADKLQEGLQTKRLGKSILFCRKVNSTNEWAKHLAKLGASEGTITIAETQTSGRGRLGRKWLSPKGGLWFSVILRPRLKPSEAVKLVFVGSLAVVEALRDLYDLPVETRWPNDVMIRGRKICGILSEANLSNSSESDYVIVGIGLNANVNVKEVFLKELKTRVTSIRDELGRRIELEELFRCLVKKLETLYLSFLNGGSAMILNTWKRYATFLGKHVKVSSLSEELMGLASDVDEEGALVLKLDDGSTRRVTAGNVSLSFTLNRATKGRNV